MLAFLQNNNLIIINLTILSYSPGSTA